MTTYCLTTLRTRTIRLTHLYITDILQPFSTYNCALGSFSTYVALAHLPPTPFSLCIFIYCKPPTSPVHLATLILRQSVVRSCILEYTFR